MTDSKEFETTVTPVPEQHDVTEAPPEVNPPDVNPPDEGSSNLTAKNEEQTETKKYDSTKALPNVKRSSSLANAQPLDSLTFLNQPRPGTNQLPTTIPNVRHMLAKYGVTLRYNVIKKKVMINIPGHSGSIDNMDNVTMTQIISLAALNGLSIGQVPPIVEALADKNLYNPVTDWINSKPWDEKDRLPEIYETITEQDGYPVYLKEILIYKWLLSLVAAVYKPLGFMARGVLTFQGPQGVGKTSWFRSLVPDEHLREMTVKTDHHYDGSKDAILGAVVHWIVEIGELDSSFKKDISRLKGFLTRDYDKIRRPYARTEAEYQRRTVFCASVNKSDFLIDDTGNTRWWVIPVTKINYQHSIDMQQLFAQLAVDFHEGKQWWLDQHEEALLELHNKDHRSVSVIRELILEAIDIDLKGDSGNPAKSASELLRWLGYKSPTNPQCRECGGILRDLLGDPKKIQGIYRWRIPLKPFKDPVSSKNKPTEVVPGSDDDF